MPKHPMLDVFECLNLHCHIQLLEVALAKEGYGHIERLGRLTERQKSKHGGCELMCTGTFAGQPARVVVKFVRDSFRKRHFDEFNSVISRVGAEKGLLIATRPSSEKFLRSMPPYSNRMIVIPGPHYVELLQKHGVGVWPDGSPNHAYLEELFRLSPIVLQKIRELKAYARSTSH